jgi:hypothetical protein
MHALSLHENALWVVTQFQDYYLFFSMNGRISLSTVTRSRSWPSLHSCCLLHDQTKERTNRTPTIRSPATEGPVLTKSMRLWFSNSFCSNFVLCSLNWTDYTLFFTMTSSMSPVINLFPSRWRAPSYSDQCRRRSGPLMWVRFGPMKLHITQNTKRINNPPHFQLLARQWSYA